MEEWDILSRVFDSNIRSHPAMMPVPLTRDLLPKLKEGYIATPRCAHGKRAFLFISSVKEEIISAWYYPKMDPETRSKFTNQKFGNNNNNDVVDGVTIPPKQERVCRIYNRKQPADECNLTILDVIIKNNQHQIEIIDGLLVEDSILIHRFINIRKDVIRDFLIRFAKKSLVKFKVQSEMEINITTNQRYVCVKDESLKVPISLPITKDELTSEHSEDNKSKHKSKKLKRRLQELKKNKRSEKRISCSPQVDKKRTKLLKKKRRSSPSPSHSRSQSPIEKNSRSRSRSHSRSQSYSQSRSKSRSPSRSQLKKYNKKRVSRSRSRKSKSCSRSRSRSYSPSIKKDIHSSSLQKPHVIELEQSNWNFFDACRQWPLPRIKRVFEPESATPNFWDCSDKWLSKMCDTDHKQTPLYIGQWEMHAVPFFAPYEIVNLPLDTCFPQADSWVFIKLVSLYGRENTIEDACFKWKSMIKNKIIMNFRITKPEHGLCVALSFIGGFEKRYNKKYTANTKGNMILNVVASHDQRNPRCLKFAFATLPDSVKESFDDHINSVSNGEFEWNESKSQWDFIRLNLDPDEKIIHVTDAVRMINQANGLSLNDIVDYLD